MTTGQAAFLLGYRDAARFTRRGFAVGDLSHADAQRLRPSSLPTWGEEAAYINGFADGAAGDTFRLSLAMRPVDDATSGDFSEVAEEQEEDYEGEARLQRWERAREEWWA